MSKRKHISWKTKCAAALAELGYVSYVDLKTMTEDQFLSLWQWDHNIFHSGTRSVARPEGGLEFTPLNPDVFWNLTPMLIKKHGEKTRNDLKIIAKSRRIRKKYRRPAEGYIIGGGGAGGGGSSNYDWEGTKVLTAMGDAIGSGLREGMRSAYERIVAEERAGKHNPLRHWKLGRKIRSRGFDKTKRRKMSGKVVKR